MDIIQIIRTAGAIIQIIGLTGMIAAATLSVIRTGQGGERDERPAALMVASYLLLGVPFLIDLILALSNPS